MSDLFDLLCAVSRNDFEAAEAALDRGASPDGALPATRDGGAGVGYIHEGTRPLLQAARKGRMRMLDWLVQTCGADLEIPCHHDDASVLSACVRQGRSRKVVARLLALGAEPHVQNDQGEGPLTYAVTKGTIAVIQILLEAGALPDVGMRDPNYGVPGKPTYTPLLTASSRGRLDIARLLLEHGADPNTGYSDPWKQNPLGVAVAKENVEMIRLLLEHGAETTPPFLTSKLAQRMNALLV